jgi:alanine racemase
VLEVDLDALRHNLRQVAAKADACGCAHMLVLKADAYGLGAPTVAAVAVEEGVGAFAVATIEEALQLRHSDADMPPFPLVLVLGAAHPSEYDVYAEHGISAVVDSMQAMNDLVEWGRRRETAGGSGAKPIRCHVMIDTGMNRLGLRSGRAGHSVDRTIGRIVAFARACGAVRFEGLCTHMAEAAVGSDYAQKQAGRFHEVFAALVRSGVAVPSVHLENSVSVMEDLLQDKQTLQRFLADDDQYPRRRTAASSWPEVPLGTNHITRGFVRVGMAVYGYYGGPTEAALLCPVATLKAQVRRRRGGAAILDCHRLSSIREMCTIINQSGSERNDNTALVHRSGTSGSPRRGAQCRTTEPTAVRPTACSRPSARATQTATRSAWRTARALKSAGGSTRWSARSAWT